MLKNNLTHLHPFMYLPYHASICIWFKYFNQPFLKCRIGKTAFRLRCFYSPWLLYVRLLLRKTPERQKLQLGNSIWRAMYYTNLTFKLDKNSNTLYFAHLFTFYEGLLKTYHLIIIANYKDRTNIEILLFLFCRWQYQ